MRIGMIGLGAMGAGMARNILAKHGQVNVVAHRARDVVEALIKAGAQAFSDPAELAQNSDVILLCLPNSAIVETVIATMEPHLHNGHTIIDTGTSSLASTAEIDEKLRKYGVAFAEAPLTGGQQQAEEGVLGALVGCDDATYAAIQPVLAHFCATLQHFGPVGSGGRAKLINNYMVIGIAALVAEAFHVADETDTDWSQLYDVVLRGSAESGVIRRIIGPARDGDFGGYVFTVANAAKDMRYITEMNAKLGRDTALNHAVKDLFDRAVAQGFGERRISELLRPEIRARLFGEG